MKHTLHPNVLLHALAALALQSTCGTAFAESDAKPVVTTSVKIRVFPPPPNERSPEWKKIVDPRAAQLAKSVEGRNALVAKMPKGTFTALDLPYVEPPFPAPGKRLIFTCPLAKAHSRSSCIFTVVHGMAATRTNSARRWPRAGCPKDLPLPR